MCVSKCFRSMAKAGVDSLLVVRWFDSLTLTLKTFFDLFYCVLRLICLYLFVSKTFYLFY